MTAPAPLHLDVEQRGHTMRLTAHGALDSRTAWQLREAMDELQRAHATVLLDLGDVTEIDDAGIDVLLRADANARRDGTTLSMTSASPAVHRALTIAGLLDRLPWAPETH